MTRGEYFDIKQKHIDMAKRCLKTLNNLYEMTSPCNISDCREFLETYCYASQVLTDLYENEKCDVNKQESINSKHDYSITVSGVELSKALTTENGIYDLSLKIAKKLIDTAKFDTESERSDHYE